MPPRASTSAAASYSDDEDFIVADEDVDSGDEFMDGDADDQRHFQNSRFSKRGGGANNIRAAPTKSKKKSAGGPGGGDASKSYAWESNFQRSWDVVNEDETGSLEASVKHLLAAGKRKRAAREERRVRRGIIRHLVLVIDDSENMNEKDGGRGRR